MLSIMMLYVIYIFSATNVVFIIQASCKLQICFLSVHEIYLTFGRLGCIDNDFDKLKHLEHVYILKVACKRTIFN